MAWRGLVAWALAWVLAGALYLLLIDTTDLPELIVGAGAAVVAATGMELAREQRIVGESVRGGWLRLAWRPLVRIPADVVRVSLMALRALGSRRARAGRFRAVSFADGEDQKHESGRRALALALGSLAPNTIMVGVDPERQLILAHQLKPTGGREAIDPLELG